MRLYVYINKEIIRSIAPNMNSSLFDINIFEYTETRRYSNNNNIKILPEIEYSKKQEHQNSESFNQNKIGVFNENGRECDYQTQTRYINIDDIIDIKNNELYYNILNNINEDNRLKNISGVIEELTSKYFIVNSNKFLIDETIYNELIEIYENLCQIAIIAYKINCLDSQNDVFKVIAIYIE